MYPICLRTIFGSHHYAPPVLVANSVVGWATFFSRSVVGVGNISQTAVVGWEIFIKRPLLGGLLSSHDEPQKNKVLQYRSSRIPHNGAPGSVYVCFWSPQKGPS